MELRSLNEEVERNQPLQSLDTPVRNLSFDNDNLAQLYVFCKLNFKATITWCVLAIAFISLHFSWEIYIHVA